jgi:hypothetical protein
VPPQVRRGVNSNLTVVTPTERQGSVAISLRHASLSHVSVKKYALFSFANKSRSIQIGCDAVDFGHTLNYFNEKSFNFLFQNCGPSLTFIKIARMMLYAEYGLFLFL